MICERADWKGSVVGSSQRTNRNHPVDENSLSTLARRISPGPDVTGHGGGGCFGFGPKDTGGAFTLGVVEPVEGSA